MGKGSRSERRQRSKLRKAQLREDAKNINDSLAHSIAVETDISRQEFTMPAPDEPLFHHYEDVFKAFLAPEAGESAPVVKNNMELDSSDEDDDPISESTVVTTISNKQRKKLMRTSVAKLKQRVDRPDLVDLHDCNSPEPELLIQLKALTHTIPMPGHWNQKRKYLQGKRGYSKPPFKLPKFIEDTGISQIRQFQLDSDENKKLKTKQRERLAPKMGRMDVDYETLHDAFFKYQTKPKLTLQGDVYYEGKEFEVRLVKARPGHVSEELRTALGMKEGGAPPWLHAMQKFGPPPSYRSLRIPGLNSPIPTGERYGETEWGRPPIDQFGNPVYGDPFGTWVDEKAAARKAAPLNRSSWGALEQASVIN